MKTSDQRLLEDELIRMNDELRRSNADLERFATVASHDLQEPLRKIQAFGDRLEAKYAEQMPEGAQDYLRRMQNAAARMSTLIEALLSFSRVATSAQPFASVDLGDLIGGVISDLEVRIEMSGGRVELGEMPTVEADPHQIRQLFQNLIGNALKFHRPDTPPLVTITSERISEPEADLGGDFFEVRVQDNGIGFDEAFLDRIFDVFQRLHGRTEYEGTGVGLAICRRILERHGGNITATSVPGQGSTFIVRLPVEQNEFNLAGELADARCESDHNSDG